MDDTGQTGEAPDGSTVRSQMGPFAIVPTWVIGGVSPLALKVYCALATFADGNGTCFPSRAKIGERAGVSPATVKRMVSELKKFGAIERTPRFVDGRQTSNDYLVIQVDPAGVPRETEGGADHDPGGVSTDPAELDQVTKPKELPPISPPATRAPLEAIQLSSYPLAVDRKAVTVSEAKLALAVLRAWNEAAGQSLTSKDWLSKIIMRIREHPDAAVEDHAEVIQFALEHPWWDGPPNPSVVYGSGAQFERSVLARAHQGPASKPALRYGRGMTTRQMLDATKGLK